MSASSSVLEVDAGDVVRLILQFLKEQRLTRTLQTLQDESNVSLNTVESMEAFQADIKNGRWDNVLSQVATLKMPSHKLMDLYEQIYLEMLEMREMDTARSLLRTTVPLTTLRQEQPGRYKRLETLMSSGGFNPLEAYPEGGKSKRRAALASSLAEEVSVVGPSRLMSIIAQSLKWQQYTGALPDASKLDLFSGTAVRHKEEAEKYPKRQAGVLKLGEKSFAQCAVFTPDGRRLITGSIDGFVEVWDCDRCKLDLSLDYQKNDELMMHEEPILSLAISRDGELLASGSSDGKLKVWHIATGQCLRKFPKAHSEGVTTLQFSRDSTQIVSASYDASIRIHGLRSGKTIKVLTGHGSYVNDVSFSPDATQLISASSDGSIKIWDIKSTECVQTFQPPQAVHTADLAVACARPLPRSSGMIVVVNNTNEIYIMSMNGRVVRTLTAELGTAASTTNEGLDAQIAGTTVAQSSKSKSSNSAKESAHFISCMVSPKGKWIYALATDNKVYCFSVGPWTLEHSFVISEASPLGLVHHPIRNVIASFANEGVVRLWSS